MKRFRRILVDLLLLILLLLLGAMASSARANDVLAAVNARRAAIGLYPLKPDPTLQNWAEYKSNLQARRGRTGHLYRGAWPGKREGTGMRPLRDPNGLNFLACNMATGYRVGGRYPYGQHTYAGAAAVVAGNRTYYTIILR